jgi:hypothetical protein
LSVLFLILVSFFFFSFDSLVPSVFTFSVFSFSAFLFFCFEYFSNLSKF